MMRSPLVMLSSGKGHFSLIPIVGRSARPSGFALTHVMFQSYVTVAAFTEIRLAAIKSSIAYKKLESDSAMLIDGPLLTSNL